jgi:23S rRNA pseudouridine1911/1915/1917 synthase
LAPRPPRNPRPPTSADAPAADSGAGRPSKSRADATGPLDTQRSSPLIGPGGKVSKAALFRKANNLPLPASGMVREPEPAPALAHPPAPATPLDNDLGAEDLPDDLGDDDALPPALAPSSAAPNAAPNAGLNAAAPAAAPLTIETDGESPLAQPASPSQTPQLIVFRLKRDLDKRLDKYLVDRVPFMSRAQLQRLIDDGQAVVNGRQAKASTRLRRADVLELRLPPPPTEHVPPQDLPIDVMFEDEHLIVLNKSPDIIVHPARSFLDGTLINALAYHFRHRSPSGGRLSEIGKDFARPGVVHRLDRQTSGCIVFAKTDQAHWQLARQFMDRTVDKRYVAFVHGRVEPRADLIDVPIGPHPSREKGYREKQVVRHDHLGKPALTFYRVLAQYHDPRRVGDVALLEVELKTGRTHQIRVHCQHRGWALLGDTMYGGKSFPALAPSTEGTPSPAIERVALHAALLSFRHPIDGRPMRFVAPLPADLRSLLVALRAVTPEAGSPAAPAPRRPGWGAQGLPAPAPATEPAPAATADATSVPPGAVLSVDSLLA